MTSRNMAIPLCVHFCSGYLFYGLQNSTVCSCGNFYGLYGVAPEDDCNLTCAGDKTFPCGGQFRNSIYKKPRTGTSSPTPTQTLLPTTTATETSTRTPTDTQSSTGCRPPIYLEGFDRMSVGESPNFDGAWKSSIESEGRAEVLVDVLQGEVLKLQNIAITTNFNLTSPLRLGNEIWVWSIKVFVADQSKASLRWSDGSHVLQLMMDQNSGGIAACTCDDMDAKDSGLVDMGDVPNGWFTVTVEYETEIKELRVKTIDQILRWSNFRHLFRTLRIESYAPNDVFVDDISLKQCRILASKSPTNSLSLQISSTALPQRTVMLLLQENLSPDPQPSIYSQLSFVLPVTALTTVILLPPFVYRSITRSRQVTFSFFDRIALSVQSIVEFVDWITDIQLLIAMTTIGSVINVFSVIVALSLLLVLMVNVYKYFIAWRSVRNQDPNARKRFGLHIPVLNIFAVFTTDDATLLEDQRTQAVYGIIYRLIEDIPLVLVAVIFLVTHPLQAELGTFISFLMSLEGILLSCATINGAIAAATMQKKKAISALTPSMEPFGAVELQSRVIAVEPEDLT